MLALRRLVRVAALVQFSIAVAQILLRARRLLLGRCCILSAASASDAPRSSGRWSAYARLDARLGRVLAQSVPPASSTPSSWSCSSSCRSSTTSRAASARRAWRDADHHRGRGAARRSASCSTGLLHYDSLGQRPQGTLGHYMTYSGTLMLVIGVAVARLAVRPRDRDVGRARHAGAAWSRSSLTLDAQRMGRRVRRGGACCSC